MAFHTLLARRRTYAAGPRAGVPARCALQCSFCATGSIGLKRQLTVDEIVDQVLFFAQRQTVDSVSFMGPTPRRAERTPQQGICT